MTKRISDRNRWQRKKIPGGKSIKGQLAKPAQGYVDCIQVLFHMGAVERDGRVEAAARVRFL